MRFYLRLRQVCDFNLWTWESLSWGATVCVSVWVNAGFPLSGWSLGEIIKPPQNSFTMCLCVSVYDICFTFKWKIRRISNTNTHPDVLFVMEIINSLHFIPRPYAHIYQEHRSWKVGYNRTTWCRSTDTEVRQIIIIIITICLNFFFTIINILAYPVC